MAGEELDIGYTCAATLARIKGNECSVKCCHVGVVLGVVGNGGFRWREKDVLDVLIVGKVVKPLWFAAAFWWFTCNIFALLAVEQVLQHRPWVIRRQFAANILLHEWVDGGKVGVEAEPDDVVQDGGESTGIHLICPE